MLILSIDILHFNADVRFFKRVLLILLTLFVLTVLDILPRLIGYLFSAQSFHYYHISNDDINGMLYFKCDVYVRAGLFGAVSKMLRMGNTILFGWKSFWVLRLHGLGILCFLLHTK